MGPCLPQLPWKPVPLKAAGRGLGRTHFRPGKPARFSHQPPWGISSRDHQSPGILTQAPLLRGKPRDEPLLNNPEGVTTGEHATLAYTPTLYPALRLPNTPLGHASNPVWTAVLSPLGTLQRRLPDPRRRVRLPWEPGDWSLWVSPARSAFPAPWSSLMAPGRAPGS